MFCSNCGFKLLINSKFCSSCGIKLEQQPDVDMGVPAQTVNSEFFQFLKEESLSISGEISDEVKNKFTEILKAKNFSKVLCNVFVSKEAIIVTPHSKDRSGLALAGLILTGGAGLIGVLGMSAGAAIGQLFSKNQSDSVQNLIKNLENTLVINTNGVQLKAYDYRTNWDLAGGEWETRISISSQSLFNEHVGDCSIVFSVYGKTYERTFFSKANNKVPELAKIIGIKVPDIQKETKFLW